MNILPKKRWHVRTRENMARVRRDEEKVAAEEKEKAKRVQLAEGEARNAALRKKSLLGSRQSLSVSEKPQHINLFEDFEQGMIVSDASNAEYEKEKKEEREKYEKQIGYLTYLGQDTVEATGCVSWYNKLPDRSSSGSESKEKKLLGDPLNDIRRYLDLEEIRRNGRKEKKEGKEKRTCTESEHNGVRRENKKSKHETYNDKKKKRARRRDTSTSSGSDTSTEHADSQSSAKKMEKMRAQRLKREQEERKRSDALLAKLRGDPDPNITVSDPTPAITQRYHSQFNPHLARQNKL